MKPGRISKETARMYNRLGIPYVGYIEGVGYLSMRAYSLGQFYGKDGGYALPQFLPVIDGSPIARICSIGEKYTVRPGDTLSGIAQHFGVSIGAVMAANNGIDWDFSRKKGDLIFAGEVLNIPMNLVEGRNEGLSMHFDPFVRPSELTSYRFSKDEPGFFARLRKKQLYGWTFYSDSGRGEVSGSRNFMVEGVSEKFVNSDEFSIFSFPGKTSFGTRTGTFWKNMGNAISRLGRSITYGDRINYGGNVYISMDWNHVASGDTVVDPILPGKTFSWNNEEGDLTFYRDTIFWIKR